MAVRYPFSSLEDFLISTTSTVDGQLDDGWGAMFPVKGREIEATILFADISSFSARTADLSSTETLIFVNNFFAWISAEALKGRPAIIDKYIGDEVMVVFSREFGSKDPFADAVDAARWMGEHDALDFAPHIGIASGMVTVGWVGTPLRYNCSVFGRPVALAARCAGVRVDAGGEMYSTSMTFPTSEWTGRDFSTIFYAEKARWPDGTLEDRPVTWQGLASRSVEIKNMGLLDVTTVVNRGMRLMSFSTEERARAGLKALANHGRYWPTA